MKKHVHTMITAFRDGFQSVYGARVFTKDFLPAVEAAREAGISHFEAGGGARFQSLYFYCNEDAFDMMDQFRSTAGENADLQTLARGVNVVGLDSQPREIIKLHADLFKKHGISTIRNFDALNDVNNLVYSGQCIHDAGLRHEVCVTMMALPPGVSGAHDPEFYAGVLRQILDADIPFDSVCFKDASGTSTPACVYDSIKQARQLLGDKVHISFHTHETAGISILQYKSALDAGANQVDCSMAPASGGTCQPDIMTLWHALRDTEYDLGIDVDKLLEAEEVFKECMTDYFRPPEASEVEPRIPFSPMPGGALTANTQMMRDNGILDRFSEVIDAMKDVIAKGGFGTSVTPVSQFYFQQAFNNVMFGPWEKIAESYGRMVLGYFGKTPVRPDPELIKICQQQLKLDPTDRDPIDINDEDPTKGVKMANNLLEEANLPITTENTFIAATCKEKGIQFLKGEAVTGVRKKSSIEEQAEKPAAPAAQDTTSQQQIPEDYTVKVNGNPYQVKLKSDLAIVNGVTYAIDIAVGTSPEPSSSGKPAAAPSAPAPALAPAGAPAGAPAAAAAPTPGARNVDAPLPGLVLRINSKIGATVTAGEAILVLESMKMETEIHSPVDGILAEIPVSQGQQVQAGDVLAVIQT